MGNLLKNIAKAAIGGAMIGAALSFLLPAFATALGMDVASTVGSMGNPAWMATFVAAFSTVGAVVTPVINYAFNGFKKETPAEAVVVEKTPVVMMMAEKAPTQEKTSFRFRDTVSNQRASVQPDRNLS